MDRASFAQQTSDRKQRGRPFGPGQSGNPSGRPKGVPNKATQEVREVARELLDDPIYRANLLERLRSGKLPPVVEALLWHYRYGKPKDILDLQTSSEREPDIRSMSTGDIKKELIARARATLEELEGSSDLI